MRDDQTQPQDGEIAVCHVCAERFEAQEELAKHLMDQHPDDLLFDTPEG
jgi:hypothetical protein